MYDHHIHNMTQLLSQRLAEKTQVHPEEIAETLREYWRDYAVHVWHVEDIFFQASQSGLPMSREAARGILMEVEHNIDCEYGITWTHIDQEIDDWAKKIHWLSLDDDTLAEYSGRFALAWHNPHLVVDIRQMVESDILLDAVQQAREIANSHSVAVQIFSTDPDEDDPEDAARFGNELMVIKPGKEKEQTSVPETVLH
ncbi:MAG: hypothetical protein AB1649_25175 [Chloroflexota bacterium]